MKESFLINNRFYKLANGLGFTFNNARPDNSVAPERFIIDLLKELNTSLVTSERRLHSLLRTWFSLYSRFLRVDTLTKLSDELEEAELRILGSLYLIAKEYDSSTRWSRLITRLEEKTKRSKLDFVPKDYPKESLDSYLLGFGIRYRSIKFQDERKFMTLEWLVSHNIWLKNRFIMTVSPRADLLSCFLINENINGYSDIEEKALIGKSSYYSLIDDVKILTQEIA